MTQTAWPDDVDSATIPDLLERHAVLLARFSRLTESDYEFANQLAMELKQLIDKNFDKPTEQNETVNARARDIKLQLDRMGILVKTNIECDISPEGYVIDSEIQLFSPKTFFEGGIN